MFCIKSLYDIFSSLNEKGYDVIYKREKNVNKEITYDQNELDSTLNQQNDILAEVEGYGVMTDFDLVNHFDNVYLFEEKLKNSHKTININKLR